MKSVKNRSHTPPQRIKCLNYIGRLRARLWQVVAGSLLLSAVTHAAPQTEGWPYTGSTPSSLVAAAQVGGHYAVADRVSDSIEIRDIRQQVLATVSRSDIQAAMPWASLGGSTYGPCGLSFSPSGRLLFISVCSGSGAVDTKDAVLRFNVNTRALDVFCRLRIEDSMITPTTTALVHYNGNLFVGTDNGLYRYTATRNSFNQAAPDQIVFPADSAEIKGLAVDIKDNKLYVATQGNLYRSELDRDGKAISLSLGSSIATLSDTSDITFGRSYGGPSNAGLYLLTSIGDVQFASASDLRSGGNITVSSYTSIAGALDLSATACGRMLVGSPSPLILSDDTDARDSFDEFLQAQFDGYVDVAKTSLLGFDGRTPVGFSNNTGMEILSGTPNDNIAQETIGWLMLPLVAAKLVNEDPEASDYIALAAQRTFGLHPDGKGGDGTIDGIFGDDYSSGTGVTKGGDEGGSSGKLILNMKMEPALFVAAKLDPDHEELNHYADYMLNIAKRHEDWYRGQNWTSKGGTHWGPHRSENRWGAGEDLPSAFITAGRNPVVGRRLANFGYERSDYAIDEILTGEPIIRDNPAYQSFSRSTINAHITEDGEWMEVNRNYYFSSIAIGDDLPSPYMTAFSAGHHPPEVGMWYGSDTPNRRPGNVIHFPALLGFGQYGYTSPAVGAYLAYRDGLARPVWTDSQIGTTPEMLLRYSVDYPEWIEPRVGPPDNWFGAVGLGNLIKPGMIKQMRTHWFRKDLVITEEDGRVRLDYSKLTPRRIYASNDGSNWIPYGDHLSPFFLPSGISYNHYKIEDPECTLMPLTNADFESGMAGWTPWSSDGTSAYSAQVRHEPNVADNSLVITANSDASTSGARQVIDVSYDLDNTRYILRGVGKTETIPAGAEAYLQIDWDADTNFDNGTLSSQVSNKITSSDSWEEFVSTVTKPANANYAHLLLVVKGVDNSGARYAFDELSWVRLGADIPIANGDFETGDFTNWTTTDPQVSIESTNVLEGSYSCKFDVESGNTNEIILSRTFDVSGDQDGFRYIFSTEVEVVELDGAEFRIDIDRYDNNSTLLDTVQGAYLDRAFDGTEVLYTRRLPGDDHYVFKLIVKRNNSTASGAASVIIDSVRLDKIKLFGAGSEPDTWETNSPSNPAWAATPTSNSPTSITMTAALATDVSGPVQYLFEEVSGNPGASSSTWQYSPVFVDKGLDPETQYSYRIRVRDVLRNQTSYSATANVTTDSPSETNPPNPITPIWSVAPTAVSDTGVTMTAVIGTDLNGPVEYYFEETSGAAGGSDSGWQTSPTFLDTELTPGTTYSYRIRMRDALGNVGHDSTAMEVATTQSAPPQPSITQWESAPAASDARSIQMMAVTGFDQDGPVEYYFDEISGNPGGDDSEWQLSPYYSDSGLQAGTEYQYRVRMRDAAGNISTYSTVAAATTSSITDTTPPSPSLSEWAIEPTPESGSVIRMTAATATDLNGPVEYYFTASGPRGADDSGWQTSPTYIDDALTPGTSYSYTVKTRDALGNTGTASASVETTTFSADSLIVEFGAPDSLLANYEGSDVTANTVETGSDSAPVITISNLDIDGVGGNDDSVEVTFAVSGTPTLTRPPSGYKLDAGYTVDFAVSSATVHLGGVGPVAGLIDSGVFTFFKPNNAKDYTITSNNPVFSLGPQTGSETLPNLIHFSVASASTDTNRVSMVRAQFFIRRAPPSPNPATFAAVPSADSTTAISMTATTGTDSNGPVEYYFEEMSGNAGGADSGWITSPSYTNTGLNAGTQYIYRVQMRDALGNIGDFSTPQTSVTTDTVAPSNIYWAEVPYANAAGIISMSASTAQDPNGPVEYYFEETSGNPGGSDSGWQTATTYSDTGLDPSTTYTYRFYTRDASSNTSAYSTTESATTLQTLDSTPPTPNPISFASTPAALDESSIHMSAVVASDPNGPVEYYFEETSGNAGGKDSGWQNSNIYTDTGLTPSTLYTYQVRVRDSFGNTTSNSTAVSATTLTDNSPPQSDPASWASVPSSDGVSSIAMTAAIGSDASGPIEYYFEEITGNAGGSDSGWQLSPTYSDTGLTAGQTYSYRVRMRDAVGNIGQYSSTLSEQLLDREPPQTDPAHWATLPNSGAATTVTMTAASGTDVSGPVEYYFEETSGNAGGTDSGWQTSPIYTDDNLSQNTSYSYRVKMRDALGNEGTYSTSESATTGDDPVSYTIQIDFEDKDSLPTVGGTWNELNAPSGTTALVDNSNTSTAISIGSWSGFSAGSDGEATSYDFSTTEWGQSAQDNFDGSTDVTGSVTLTGFDPSDRVEVRLIAIENNRQDVDYQINGSFGAGNAPDNGEGYRTRNDGWSAGKTMTWVGLTGQTSYTLTAAPRAGEFPVISAMRVLVREASSGETDAPTPNAASFASLPSAISNSSISMTATIGSDANGPVEYYFEETSGNTGGANSGWQTSPSYTDTHLKPSTLYRYTVRMRDALGNYGAASAEATATTDATVDTTPPQPDPSGWIERPIADSDTVISMTAITGTDASGPVEYYFDETTGNSGGADSGWQSSPVYINSGLSPLTTYSYVVRMRDALENVGNWSSVGTATTAAFPDVTAPIPNPTTWANVPVAISHTAIRMTATTGWDENGTVEYAFEETSGNPGATDSGWQTSSTYLDDGLNPLTQYSYRVRMRDGIGNLSAYSNVETVSTLAEPDITPPNPDPATWDIQPTAVDSSTITMTASIGNDASGTVEYYFEETTNNQNGNNSPFWQSSPTYTDTDLIPGETYAYRVRMRDAEKNIGGYSTIVQVTLIDDAAPSPNPPTWASAPLAASGTSINMVAVTGSDPSGPVEYYFEETTGNPGASDSGWQTSPSYTDTGLHLSTSYSYRFRMRDANGYVTIDSPTASAETLDDELSYAIQVDFSTISPNPFAPGTWNNIGSPSGSKQLSDTASVQTSIILDAWQNFDQGPEEEDDGVFAGTSFAGAGSDGFKLSGGSPASFSLNGFNATDSVEIRLIGLDNQGQRGDYTINGAAAPGFTDLYNSRDCWSNGDTLVWSNLSGSTSYNLSVTADASWPSDTPIISAMIILVTPAGSDNAAPTPSPASFTTLPSALNESSIRMTATIGSDASGIVEYYFEETSGNAGGSDSGWQSAPSYTNSGLLSQTQYTYTVRMRDALGNTTTTSAPSSATTLARPTVTLTAPADAALFTEGDTITLSATASDPDGSISKIEFYRDGILLGESLIEPHTYIWSDAAIGTFSLSATAIDNDGLSTSTTPISVTVEPDSPSKLFRSTLSAVSSDTWQTVNFGRNYNSAVIIATPILPDATHPPVITRLRNVSGTDFDIKIDRVDGQTGTLSVDVSIVAVEEGVFTVAEHGVKMEAAKFDSTVTSGKSNWVAESRSYQNSYTNPVIVGQVMSANDPNWSVFWCQGSGRTAPPSSTSLSIGKHIGEDPNQTRVNETIGYIVIESGAGTMDGINLIAGLGSDSLRGPDDSSTGYTYNFNGLSSASSAAISLAAMDGNDGAWAVLFGSSSLTVNSLTAVTDEDTLNDSERSHTAEQAGYIVLE